MPQPVVAGSCSNILHFAESYIPTHTISTIFHYTVLLCVSDTSLSHKHLRLTRLTTLPVLLCFAIYSRHCISIGHTKEQHHPQFSICVASQKYNRMYVVCTFCDNKERNGLLQKPTILLSRPGMSQHILVCLFHSFRWPQQIKARG
jgi:hypothetical protein